MRYQDIDFKNRTVSVRQVLNHDGKSIEPGAKTASGVRAIGIDKVTAELSHRVKEEKLRNRDIYEDNGLLICTSLGTPLSPSQEKAKFIDQFIDQFIDHFPVLSKPVLSKLAISQ